MVEKKCPKCGIVQLAMHLHDTAYGLDSTHMAGSERWEFKECGHVIFAKDNKNEDLEFVLDR